MKIDPAKHGWMTAAETQSVFTALGEARFVGGAVRNALLGEAVIDIDIAVPISPQDAMGRLEKAGIKVVPTGIDHGTVTAIKNDKVFEVTSLRRDVETDGRHAIVAYTDDWREDSQRRDFTMNALYAAADGEIFDFHDGVADLIAGHVRFVGEPAARIAEDYLRILRLFRFHAWYGKGEIDDAALRASAAAKAHIAKLSGERIAKELLRLLEAPNPLPAVRMMGAAAILPEVLPGALQPARLERLVEIEQENGFPPDSLLRLAALLPADAQAVDAAGERLKLPNAGRARLNAAVEGFIAHPSAHEVRRLLYRQGAPRFKDQLLLKWAQAPKGAGAMPWRMLLSMADGWQRPKFPLTGRDVMLAGVPEGPAVGRILDAVEAWWIDNDFPEGSLAERLKIIMQSDLP